MRGNVILRLKNWHKFIIGMWSILLFAGVNGQSVEDQLYFITGVSSDKMDARFSCSLYRLEGAQVKNVNDIVNQDAGIDFIDIDYDAQRVVIGFPPVRPFGLSVLNMKSPGSTYGFSLPLPPQPEYAVVARYFVETQTQDFGLAERWFSAVGSEGGGAQARKADMLTVKWLFGSKRGSEILPGQKIRYCRWTGWSGTAVWTGGVMYVRAGRDGKLRQAGGDDSLEIPCPQALSSQLDKTFALAVNNSEVAVLQPEELGSPTLYVLSKAQGTWRSVSIPAGLVVRSFGEWVAGIVVEQNRDNSRQSPGKEIRQMEMVPATQSNGRHINMNVENLFEQSAGYYPGKLFAYNAKTNKSYDIQTGQGDSEIILATNSFIYYRINDTLFRAAIEGSALGKGIRIAQDPRIIQAHWAFVGPR